MRSFIGCLLYCFLMIFVVLPVATAQQAQPVPAIPPSLAQIPPGLLNAKSVFISNAGSDSGLFPHPFSGDPDRPYVEFYGAVAKMQRWKIVEEPGAADLVLELRLYAPNGPQTPNKQNGASDPLPMLRLVVYDRPTHYALWAFTESVYPAALQKTHDRNLDDALALISTDLSTVLSNQSPPARTPAKCGLAGCIP